MARPAVYTEQVIALVDEKTAEYIRTLAETTQVSQSEVLRSLIADGMRARGVLPTRRKR